MSSRVIIYFPQSGNEYPMEFKNNMNVYDVCREIRSNIREASVDTSGEYGIFMADPDPRHCFWLDNSRLLSYYHLCENAKVEFRSRLRLLSIQTMDGTKKVLQVDDSKTVAELLVTVCSKMGISNYEEYSLIRPLDEDEKMRTLTLRKAKSLAKDQEKLEKMKQKLHTDDELNWLAHGKTLRQQGVDNDDILLLRRKYFFSDQNVDTRDPVQLNLLYIQLKEAIINGTHPISLEQAVNLAALQCQSEMGMWNTDRANRFSIDLKYHLPKEYAKSKGVEKRIQERYRSLGNFDEKEAKLRYIQLCRSLPTYGITFFLIKEKLKGRNKLVPRLFGVSKESVMRVDEKTKEILETWPLTRIRRWAAGPNLFTLDFGQYSPDGNYIMQTTEGEQIGQILSGYIDIIVRRQRSGKAMETDGNDEESTIIEESVVPSRANLISNLANTLPRGQRIQETNLSHSGIIRTASPRGDFSEGHIAMGGQAVVQHTFFGGSTPISSGITNGDGQAVEFKVIDLGQPKRALVSRIDFGLRTIHEAAGELELPIYPDDAALRGDDMNTRRWRSETLEQARAGILSHLGAMTMATGHLVTLSNAPTSPGLSETTESSSDLDYVSMDASVASIGINVNGLMQCIRLYEQIDAADASSEGYNLRQATQSLSDAFLSLMKAATPTSPGGYGLSEQASGPRSKSINGDSGVPDRAALLEAAGRVGDASRQLMQLIASPVSTAASNESVAAIPPVAVVDWESRDKLLSATKTVAHQMANLVKTAKAGAVALAQEAASQNAVSGDTDDQVHLAAAQLLQSTQNHLVQTATVAGRATSRLVTCAKVTVCTMEQPESQQQLVQVAKEVGVAADGVERAVDDLIRVSQEMLPCWGQHAHESHLQLGDNLHEGVLALHNSLDALVDCLRVTTIQAHQDPVVGTLLTVASQLPNSLGDGTNLVAKANNLVSVAYQLAQDLETEAAVMEETSNSLSGLPVFEAKQRASLLHAAIHQLLLASKECTDYNVQSLEHQKNIVETARRLVETTQTTAAPIIRARLTRGLEFATRLTAFNVGPLVTVGGEAVRICQGNTYKDNQYVALATDLEKLQKRVMPQVNLSCNEARVEPYSAKKQANLLAASQNLMQCLEDLLRSADAVAPTISDAGIQTAFTGATKNTQACLTDLRLCYTGSEPVLASEPLPFYLPDYMIEPEASQSPGTLALTTCRSQMEAALKELNGELRVATPHRMLLPDETLDSICVALWTAVAQFNRSFAGRDIENRDERTLQESRKLPPFVFRIALASPVDRNHKAATTVVTELVDRLTPLIRGISGMVAFLENVANAQVIDPSLARVLLVSHGLADKRQSGLSGRVSPTESAGDLVLGSATPNSPCQEQAQSTAAAMSRHLVAIGDSCLTDASQLIAWALTETGSEAINPVILDEATLIAEQLTNSVNAILGYVPGEVIVRRLSALLDDAKGIHETRTHVGIKQASSSPLSPVPVSPNRHFFPSVSDSGVYEQLAAATQRLAKVCADSSTQVTNVHRAQPTALQSTDPIGVGSKVVLLAQVADRITGALADVIRSTGSRAGAPVEAFSSLFDDLISIGQPLIANLRSALRGASTNRWSTMVDGPSGTSGLVPLSQVLLRLRQWAVEVNLQATAIAGQQETQHQHSTVKANGDGISWSASNQQTAEEAALSQMRAQCEASLRRVATLLHSSSATSAHQDGRELSSSPPSSPVSSSFASYASPAVGLIRLPVSSQTYPQCYCRIEQLDREIMSHLLTIPTATKSRDPEKFVSAVKAVTSGTCQLMHVINQTAYLIGAAHPASKPGHFDRFEGSSNQLTVLHDHVAAVRKGASELSRVGLSGTPDGLPPLEVLNMATNMAQRASQLCQITRPLLTDCAVPSEKKQLAESLERVARAAAAVFTGVKTLQASPAGSSTANNLDQLRGLACHLEEAVDEYAGVFLHYAGGSPSQVADEAFSLQAPVLEVGQEIAACAYQVLESSQHMVVASDQATFEKASECYSQTCSRYEATVKRLAQLVQGLVPGLKSCVTVNSEITNLLSNLDDTSLTLARNAPMRTCEASSRLETSLTLMQTSLRQLTQQLCIEAVENWKQDRWELIAHNLNFAASYLPSLVTECTRSATQLQRSTEQAELFGQTRTVLEASQQLINQGLKIGLQTRISNPSAPESNLHDSVANSGNSLQRACVELSLHVDQIAKHQGGLNWHIAAINAASAKLDDSGYLSGMESGHLENQQTATAALPTNFVQLHTGLGYQSRALYEAAVRLVEVAAASSGSETASGHGNSPLTSPDTINTCIASVTQRYEQIAETSRSMACLLASQSTRINAGQAVAKRLCQVVQAIGAACVDLLRSPLYSAEFNTLVSRLDDLKSVLQSYVRGAEACSNAASGIGRLVADLDTAALFTRAGTSSTSDTPEVASPSGQRHFFSRSGSGAGASTTGKLRLFETTQESTEQAIQATLTELDKLVKGAVDEQEALTLTAQNCLLRATELTESVKKLTSRSANAITAASAASRSPSSPAGPSGDRTSDANTVESNVQVLTATRDVLTGVVNCLNQARSVTTTRYALEAWGDGESSALAVGQGENKLQCLLTTHQTALCSAIVETKENRVATLMRSLQAVSELVQQSYSSKPSVSPFTRTISNPVTGLAHAVPPKPVNKLHRTTSESAPGIALDSEKSNVRLGLTSVLSEVTGLQKRLEVWSVVDGNLCFPASDQDWEAEANSATGKTTRPAELVAAARAITQAVIKANSATTGGRPADMALSGDLVRRAADNLVRCLRPCCQSALAAVTKLDGAEWQQQSEYSQDDRGNGNMSVADVELACRRAISGAVNTMAEIRQMMEYMDKTLTEGSSSPSSMQVTLAMRRLRNTVHEIVEGATLMPGANEDEETIRLSQAPPAVLPKPSPAATKQSTTFIKSPAVLPKPVIRAGAHSEEDTRRVKFVDNLSEKELVSQDVERSIAEAKATAPDQVAVDCDLQMVLTDMTGQLERDVARIGQLHHYAVRRSASLHQSSAQSTHEIMSPAASRATTGPNNSTLQPTDSNTSGDLDEVLAACKHVVHTTLGLMYWAAAAQRELVQQGRLPPTVEPSAAGAESSDLETESQWAYGLISAARYVAAAANHLVQSAQALVSVRTLGGPQSQPSTVKPEALISAAQTTAARTAHLVIACVAKSDPTSASCKGLRSAGAAVKRATEYLAKIASASTAASRSGGAGDTVIAPSVDGLSSGVVSSMRQVIETKSSIATKQKELETLHTQLKHIHQDQYRINQV